MKSEIRNFHLCLRTVVSTSALVLLLQVSAHSAILLNEILVNPPGTDNGVEFLELRGSSGGIESMSGLTFLVIEGDGTAPGAGVIDVALSLSAFSTGTNGLFLWRDAATVLSPAPDPATTLNVADFNPDLENGSNTFLIVNGFSGSVGTDLDAGDDGTLDSTPWTSVIDAIGFAENDGAANVQYATSLGFAGFAANAGFNPDVLLRLTDGTWISSDILGTSPGPFTLDPARNQNLAGASLDLDVNGSLAEEFDFSTVTPGGRNPTLVPESAGLALFGGAILAAFSRRR